MKNDKTTIVSNINLINSLLSHSTKFYIPIFFLQNQIEPAQIGLIIAISTIIPIFFSIFIGKLNDKIQSNKFITISLFLLAINFMLIYFFPYFLILLILFSIKAILEETYHISIGSYLLKKQENISQILNFKLLAYFGAAIGLFLGAYLLEIFSFFYLFFFAFLIYLFLSFKSKKLEEVKKLKPKINFALLKEMKNKKVFFFFVLWFFFSIHYGAELVSYGNYLKEELELSFLLIAFFMAVPILFMAATLFLLKNKINDKNIKWYFLFGMFLSGIGHMILAYPVLEIAFFGRIIHEIGDSLAIALSFVIISKLFKKENIGSANGLLRFFTILATSIGSLFSGYLSQFYGNSSALFFTGLISVLSSIFLYVFYKFKK